MWPSSLLQPRLVRDGDPASKGPGGALGFLRCRGALTQHLILTCPAQPSCWGTGGVSGDGTTRLPQWASIGTLIHSMTLETTERVGRNAVQNILQSKNAWLVVWKVCLCVSPEYSVVRPPGVVQGVGPEAVSQHHPLAEGLVLIILLRKLCWPVNAKASTIHCSCALVNWVLDALAL